MTDEREERHHTDAEYDELKRQRDGAVGDLNDLLNEGYEEMNALKKERDELKAKLEESDFKKKLHSIQNYEPLIEMPWSRGCHQCLDFRGSNICASDGLEQSMSRVYAGYIASWCPRVSHEISRLRAELAQLKKDK